MANTEIKPKKLLKDLGGQCFVIDNSDIRPGVNDFSLIYSQRLDKQKMFLGLVAFVNHDCEGNTAVFLYILLFIMLTFPLSTNHTYRKSLFLYFTT